MQPIIVSIVAYYDKKVNQQFINTPYDDLYLAALEGIALAIDRLDASKSDNFFAFIRKHIKGSILTTIRNLAFACKVNANNKVEKIPLSLIGDEDEDLEPASADEDADSKNLPLFGVENFPIAEIELRDFIRKLPDPEAQIVKLLLEGYEVNEIPNFVEDFDKHINSLREKLAQFLFS